MGIDNSNKVGFFTPVVFKGEKSFGQKVSEKADAILDTSFVNLSGRKVTVKHVKGRSYEIETDVKIEKKENWKKILIWCLTAGIAPLAALATKFISRKLIYKFEATKKEDVSKRVRESTEVVKRVVEKRTETVEREELKEESTAIPTRNSNLDSSQTELESNTPAQMLDNDPAVKNRQKEVAFESQSTNDENLTDSASESIMSHDYVMSSQPLACGSKHANLIRLHEICKGMDGVKVPLPFGLTEEAVLTFLQRKAPLVFEYWKELTEKYSQSTSFLNTDEAKKRIDDLQKIIEQAFSNLTEFPEFKAITDWLKDVGKLDSFLMVRSTGSEDTDIANAGGNLSVSYVEPYAAQVFEAAGKVIASYFSPSSLENRINAGENPFNAPLKLAVTMQELIGEPVGGEKDPQRIPVSLVLFTNEPYYVGENKNAQFRIMRINACLGHGEGVVNNKGIVSDSVLVLQSRVNADEIYFLYDNQVKPERLAPTRLEDTIALQSHPNPEELTQKPTIDPALVKRLFSLGVAVEKAFSTQNNGPLIPVDMELVVKEGVIYPVQARPVNRKIAIPTYLDTAGMEDETIKAGMRAEKILVAATSSATTITQKNEILIADTLEKAERSFNKSKHKLVIVGQDEPPLSHPVVNFSGMAIPCLYYYDLSGIRKLTSKVTADTPLLVCLQEGTIYPWDTSPPPIQQGYTTHPAHIQVSMEGIKQQLPMVRKQVQEVVPLDLQGLLIGIRAVKTREVAAKALSKHSFLQLATRESDKLKERVSNLESIPEEVKFTIEAISKLKEKIEHGLSEFMAAKNESRNELEILFHAKTLQQLISQEERGVAQLSLATLPKFVAAAELAIGHQENLPAPSFFARETIVSKDALNPKIAEKWLSFLKDLEMLPELTKERRLRFKEMINYLEKTGALGIWVNTFFAPLKGNANEILENLLKDDISDAFIRNTFTLKNDMLALEKKVGLFGNPATFDAAQKCLKDLLVHFKREFPDNFKKSSKIEKLIAVPLMTQFISLFDASIKSMKASPDFPNKEIIFRSMLTDYLSLFDTWATNLFSSDEWALHSEKKLFVVESYIGDLKYLLPESHGLDPSENFSVAAAILGTGTTFSNHLPETLEDCFTLIHQNLINITQKLSSSFFTPELLQSLDLSPTFTEAMKTIEQGKYQAKLTNFSIENRIIQAHYNIPLRNHCAAITLIHNLNQRTHSIKLGLYGLQGASLYCHDRWLECWSYLRKLESFGLLKIQGTPSQNDQHLIIEVGVESPKKFSFLLNQITVLIKFASLSVTYQHSFLLEKFFETIMSNILQEIDGSNKENMETSKIFKHAFKIPEKVYDILQALTMEEGPLKEANNLFYHSFFEAVINVSTNKRKNQTPEDDLIDNENLISVTLAIEKLVENYDQKDENYLARVIRRYRMALSNPLTKEIVHRMQQNCTSEVLKDAIDKARNNKRSIF